MLRDKEKHQGFIEEYGLKSGVDYITAKQSGIDQDAFKKVKDTTEIQGELVLKIWNNKGRVKMLWCYILIDENEGVCFPVFRGSADKISEPLLKAELGSFVTAQFSKTKNDKCFCTEAIVL